ncbi:MAG TPA: sugar phosphate nucleotidyltransferase [Paludibacteraceae bacterium]|nr:sugar phosphate nucleotidyltransferase [Paludibacteraceae bacterium]
MKPTLLVLAAGMGSRYGSLKQLDGVGPNGETIMDYSVYDAVRAGFGKVVFVIRHSFEAEFRTQIVSKYENHIPVEVVFQEIDSVPAGSTYDKERVKPWGTNHAVLMAKDVIDTPFAVINSDDFYGRESYQLLADFLQNSVGKIGDYCMIAYHISNTLSESGAVNRGVCSVDEHNLLTSVVERTKIESDSGVIHYPLEHGGYETIPNSALVSMNMWGFTPDYFEFSKKSFAIFLAERGMEPQSEYYIPTVVDELIANKKATCKVIDTPAKWFGVTYTEDRPQVVLQISKLIREGVYPQQLWK